MKNNNQSTRFFDDRRRILIGSAALASSALFTSLQGVRSARAQDPPNDCPAPPTGGTPFVQGQDTRPILERKSISSLAPSELAQLAQAFTTLRAISSISTSPPANLSWILQADLHALYCHKCNNDSVNIHNSWNFLPWHRAYLYYYERILGSLVGNLNGFRLPFWDWEKVRGLPTPYNQPSATSNPLWDMLRNSNLAMGGHLPMTDGTTDRIVTLNGITDFSTFGGNAAGPGGLENDPHDLIHDDTGQSAYPYYDMGNLGFAARDPLFFSHHCNIDKLWSHWNGIKGGPPGSYANPTDATFLSLRWSFYDETGAVVSISAADVLDHEQSLRYRYPYPAIGIPLLLLILECELIYRGPGPDPGPILQLTERNRVTVSDATRAGKLVVLVLRDVQVPIEAVGTFDIEAVQGKRHVHLGSITSLIDSMHDSNHVGKTLVLNATAAAEMLFAAKDPATIRVVPRRKQKSFVLRAKSAQIRIQSREGRAGSNAA
jgi:hypothetical protein